MLTCLLTFPGHATAGTYVDEQNSGAVQDQEGPDSVQAMAGIIYLGGHRLTPPFTLKLRQGSITVNGFWVEIPPESVREVSPMRRAQHFLLDSLTTLAKRLHADGLPDSQILDSLSIHAASSRTVNRTSKIGVSGLAIEFTDGFVINLRPFGRGREGPPPGTKREREQKRLLELKRALDSGSLLVIARGDCRVRVPYSRVQEFESAILQLRAGLPVTGELGGINLGEVDSTLVRPVDLSRSP